MTARARRTYGAVPPANLDPVTDDKTVPVAFTAGGAGACNTSMAGFAG